MRLVIFIMLGIPIQETLMGWASLGFMGMLPFHAISLFNHINGSTSHLELGQLFSGTHHATCVVTFDDVA